MKSYYLFGSRILTHVSFWVIYYISFSFIWAKDSNYFDSFFLEFVLLPIRILAVYFTIYILIPKWLSQAKYLQFFLSYAVVMIVCGVLQRLFIHFFYDGLLGNDPSPIFHIPSMVRAMILINSTVLFVSAIKISQLWQQEKEKNEQLMAQPSANQDIIEIKADKRIFRIAAKDILYIEGLGNYVTYHLSDRKIISYISLKEALKELPEAFIRVHKSYVVNRDHISSYNSEDLEVKNAYIPVGRSYKAALEI
ncbi:MAG: LytTR family DNA-binding domain-containing protein [Bacteroidota bacterium]